MDAPRMLYSGPADDTARVKVFQTVEAVTEALAVGWRLRRTGNPETPVVDASEPSVVDAPETTPDASSESQATDKTDHKTRRKR